MNNSFWLENQYFEDSSEDESNNNGNDSNELDNTDESEQALEPKDNKKEKKSPAEKAQNVKDTVDKAKKAKEVGTKVGKLSKILGPIMPVLGYIAIIVAVLIAAIGLLMFLLTMPGAILGKIKALAQDFGNALINLVVGEANNVKQSQISEVATNLEDMGYDLYSYGFESDKVKPQSGTNFWGSTVYYTEYLEDNEIKTHDFFDPNYEPDMDTLRVTEDGILRDKNGIVYIESDYIRAYLVSDNYVYMIRNNNFNLINAFKKMLELEFFRTLFTGNFGDGLINLYHEKNGLGTLGDNFGVLDSVGGFLRALFGGSRISISIDRPAKQLVVTTEVHGYYGVKRKFLYNLDGWTGRYGMPLEFLLSLHLSSMQPDLAYDLVTKTETELQLVTHESKATVKGGIKIDENEFRIPAGVLDQEYVVPSGIFDTEQLTQMRDELVSKLISKRDDLRGYTDFGYYASFTLAGTEEGARITEEYEAWLTLVRNYFNAYINKAKQLNTEFDTFIPYIYAVRCHWFRDVYFTDNERSNFIETDVEYEERTAQRWTKYETVSADELGIDTEDLDNTITYGEGSDKYAAERSEYTRGGLGDVQYVLYYYEGGDLSKERVYKYEGKYGTKEDAEIDENLSQVERDSLHKKAITSSLDWKYYKDVEGNSNYEGKLSGVSDRWVAYKEIQNQDSGWQKYEPDNSGGEEDKISEEEAKNLYYKIILSSAIAQIEDGQRGPTNSLTKQIFSINKYYTYNGTAERAADIDEDRYGSAVKNEYKKYKKGENTSFNTESDPRNKDLIETFSVTRDSISAFNILTNMNTLDSDAIYHDFKELIVELNFFDKEELTAVPNESFEWPLPEVGSRGWPIRLYSKYENEYGTALHSKYTLNFLRQRDAISYTIEDNSEEPTTEGEPEEYIEEEESEVTGLLTPILQTEYIGQIQGKATEFMSPFDDLELMGSGGVAESVGASVGDVDPSEVSVEDFLAATKTMAEEMCAEGFNYCVGSSCSCPPEVKKMSKAEQDAAGIQRCSGVNHCHHHPHPEDGCWWQSDYKVAIEKKKKRNTCCATFVSWSLVNVGVMRGTVNKAGKLGDFLKANFECEVLQPGDELQPGDIMFKGRGHTYVLGEEDGSGYLQYDGGHSVMPGTTPGKDRKQFVESAQPGWDSGVTEAIRIFGVSTKDKTEKYNGYKGGELVVSPVTGMVIQAGVSQEITNIETGLKEYVGFIKIRVLDRTDFTAAFGKEGSTDEGLEGFKYFLEEYEDNKVAGNIMYIEGFHMEVVKEDGVDNSGHKKYVLNVGDSAFETNLWNSTEETLINEYTKKSYDGITNKKTKKRLEEKEKAREDTVPYYIDNNGNFFIKEGSALGTTYIDGDYEIDYQKYLNELREKNELETVGIVGKEQPKQDERRWFRERTLRPSLANDGKSDYLYDDTGSPSNLDILKEKGNGNYIRLVMRASKDGLDAKVEKDSIIEDVEDYIEIAPKVVSPIEWFWWFWTPHESGPADPNGPICYESHGNGGVTIGMIQWFTASSGTNNVAYLCRNIGEFDSKIGNAVSKYGTWTNQQIISDCGGNREIEKSFQTENSSNHDGLMWAELEVATKQYMNSLLEKHPWLKTRHKAVQGAIVHLGIHDGHYPSNIDDWADLDDDHDVLDKLAEAWKNSGCSDWAVKEVNIAKGILDGKLNEDDVEYWVRNKDVQYLIDHGVDYNGTGS